MNLFFIECSLEFWVDVAEKMMRQNNWRIIYWTGSKNLENVIKKNFSDTIFHHNAKAVRNICPIELDKLTLPSLGNDILERFSKCESNVMKMMDRMARVKDLSYQERINHYHGLLRYWLGVCKKLNPELVIWPTSPHLVYDYILYEICKHYNIKTIMFEKTAIPGYLLALKRFEQSPKNLISLYEQECDKDNSVNMDLPTAFQSRINEIKGEYGRGMPFHVKYKNKKKRKSVLYKLYSSLKAGAPPNFYQKYPYQRMHDLKISKLRYCSELIKTEILRDKLKNYYNKISVLPDLSKPFIFVALQCQPERSTSPDGRAFVHQNLMVEMLSQNSPKNWSIYVKEHISQFKGFQRADCGRTKEFYDDMLKIPKVKLLSLNISSFELIDTAKAVATVSGTVGFESIVRETPALIFGHAWYNICEGAFQINNSEDCLKYISRIHSGYKVDADKIKKFLKAFERISTKGYIDNIYAGAVNICHKDNAQSIYETIVNKTLI